MESKIASAVLIAASAALVGCEGQQASGTNNADKKQDAVTVETIDVRAESFTEKVRAVGTLRARAAVVIRPEVAGILKEIHFQEGEPVSEGQRLFSIDDQKLRHELEERQEALKAAQAQLENSQRQYERARRLMETDAISEEERDRLETQLATDRAELRRLDASINLIKERLDDTVIRAPFNGVTGERHVDAGSYVQVADELVSLYALSPIELSVKIPERYVDRVRKGQQAEILVDGYPDRRFVGTATFVSPEVDELTRTFLVKITTDNEQGLLRPGSFGTALLTLKTLEGRPAVPEEALVATTEGYIVFLVEEGAARMRQVQVGLRDAGRAEITEGVQVGEAVVRAGHMRLSEGTPVKMVDSQATASQSESSDTGISVTDDPAATPQEELRR